MPVRRLWQEKSLAQAWLHLRQLQHAHRRGKGAVMSLVGTYWRRCLGERRASRHKRSSHTCIPRTGLSQRSASAVPDLPNKRSHLLETSGLAGANIPTVYALSGKTVVERADTLAQQCYGAAAT